MIEEGNEVQVIDHKSGDDVTGNTLTQVLLLRKKVPAGVLPQSFINEIIQSGSKSVHSFQTAFLAYIKNTNLLDYLPTREDITRLQENLDKLNKRLDQMETLEEITETENGSGE